MNLPVTKSTRDAIQSHALQLAEDELLPVLKSSLYPGAEDASIKLVIGYCVAAGLDPMQKPVHIVPMRVKTGTDAKGKPTYAMRDVIMPGVGLYRTQAARSGQLAGISEPEFGPMIAMEYDKKIWEDGTPRTVKRVMEFPEWCRVTVRRAMANGQVADFTATEYWMENYATAGRDNEAPNEMWIKRPRGQLAKCAQAQALRMAFPEMTGSAPTADEMTGKQTLDEDGEIIEHAPTKPPVQLPQRKVAPVPDPRKMPHTEHAADEDGVIMDPPAPAPAPAVVMTVLGGGGSGGSDTLASANETAYLKRKYEEAGLDLDAELAGQALTKQLFQTLKSRAIDVINAR
jgi:phage recombination protein Bet